MATDWNGNAISGGQDTAWSAPVGVDPIAGILTSVSCPSGSFCAAVASNGYAFTWNAASWSRPTSTAGHWLFPVKVGRCRPCLRQRESLRSDGCRDRVS